VGSDPVTAAVMISFSMLHLIDSDVTHTGWRRQLFSDYRGGRFSSQLSCGAGSAWRPLTDAWNWAIHGVFRNLKRRSNQSRCESGTTNPIT
jgi:hypothetical protein